MRRGFVGSGKRLLKRWIVKKYNLLVFREDASDEEWEELKDWLFENCFDWDEVEASD